MKTEKKYLMYGIALILLTLVGVSLAYFVTEIVGSSKTVSVSTGDLRIVFTNGESITGNDIEPGCSTTKTFSVENKTNSSYDYNIVIEDLVNTFSTDGYLVYKITSTDGGYNMNDYVDVPKSSIAKDVVLAYSISIPSKTTHNYTIEIRHNNSDDADQSEDMNSTLSGNIYIGVGTPPPTLAEAILRDNSNISTRSDFSVINVANTTGTIYKTTSTEDSSIVYYYSGNTTNNWVKFGKYNSNGPVVGLSSLTGSYAKEYETLEECNSDSYSNYNCHYLYQTGDDIYWRIIRTNEDGSIRLLYAGNSHDTTDGYIGASAFNDNYDESRYVGYMYGGNTSLEDNRNNTTSSTIKNYLDSWYETNLLDYYDKYISKSAIYCNDRSVSDGNWSNNVSSDFDYGSEIRLDDNKTPTYKCGGNTSGGLFESKQATQDKFSASTIGGGNGLLTYPIALMTADEVAFAGGVRIVSLTSPYAYYYTNSAGFSITGHSWWWLLSPHGWRIDYPSVFDVFCSFNSTLLSYFHVGYSLGVRPVVSLNSCAQVTGSGTPEDPYIIDEASSTC